MFKTSHLLMGAAIAALSIGSLSVGAQAGDEILADVLKRLEKLERENAKLRSKVEGQDSKIAKVKKSSEAPREAVAYTPPAATLPPLASDDGWYLHKKDGEPLTFQTPGGEVTLYGVLDVSVDATTKGIKNKRDGNGVGPVGNAGWLGAVSSNLSRVGIKGSQKLGDEIPAIFLYQLETQIDVAVNSGLFGSNSNQSNVVRGGLTTRDSFIGLENKQLGAIKVGKTEAPYKKSTDVFNPFNAQLGDYRVIMGNSGGDNRVEFMTRMEHSIWWESPNWSGLKLSALYSPGQNRANDSSNVASGSSDCAGGNNPNSGGGTGCQDGAFSDAISASATFTTGDLLLVAAYERHEKVNRSSDVIGNYADPANPTATEISNTIADSSVVEDAFKVGALYKFPTKTTVGFLYERMNRDVSASLAFQNERSRDGTWLFVTQELTPKDSVSFGWAHAFATPGDPGGQANNPAHANPKNEADLLTAAYSHQFSKALNWYIDYAATLNQRDAHYDLGAGGHGVTTDDHDATGANGGAAANGAGGRGFVGGTVQGISTGLKYQF